ncbi:OmpH family outer membrane protein [Candidatus Glomeribacter gigasporarum]|uniref:OmpH family outer membrane protein n=1 Tax=Candidatus Glomeribacter gigasporarum TaxID=132144 RepID=UPI0002ED6BD7|nr:OmpH family outer membrane protein [Candidatus Glomeribacter gigasporarum]
MNRISQSYCLRLVLLGLFFSHSPAAFSEAKPLARIAVVDSDRILRESAAIQQAQQQLEQEFSGRDHELRKIAQRVQSITEKLNKKGDDLPDVKRSAMQTELAQLNADFQRKQHEFNEAFNQRRNEKIAAVVDDANRVIQKIAQADQYDLIVQEAVYFNPRIDITDQVLKALAEPGFAQKINARP